MPLTDEQQLKLDIAIAGRNQRFLQDLEKLSDDMSKVFEKIQSIGLYVAVNPEVATLTDEYLADLGKHYSSAKLTAALTALSEISTASATNQWTSKILGIY